MKLTDAEIVHRVLEGGRKGHTKGGEVVRKAFAKRRSNVTQKVNERRK